MKKYRDILSEIEEEDSLRAERKEEKMRDLERKKYRNVKNAFRSKNVDALLRYYDEEAE